MDLKDESKGINVRCVDMYFKTRIVKKKWELISSGMNTLSENNFTVSLQINTECVLKPFSQS